MKFSMLFFMLFCSYFLSFGQDVYLKNRNNSDQIISEGWINNQKHKKGYWYYYYLNGKVKSEGHYKENKKTKWWVFYNEDGTVKFKCQFKKDLKDGYSLCYKENKLYKSEKFKENKKLNEWFSISDFRKENNLSDLK